MKFWPVVVQLFFASSLANTVYAASGEDVANEQCSSCHALQNPEYQHLPVSERRGRMGPPLYYAGNKFRRDWLVGWLQEPAPIRPAGYYPPVHVVNGDDGDIVNEASLSEHVKLSTAEAEQVADFLMSLTPYASLLEDVTYEPGSISWKMGNLNFGKFNGCDACHRDAPDYGGVSGPELYTAWQRLQPKYIASYITNPVAWDPHTLMPHKELNPAVVKKLVDYIKVNGDEE